MTGLLSIVVLILDAIAIIDIFKSARDMGKKALWTLVVVLLPLVGMVVYFLVGKKKA